MKLCVFLQVRDDPSLLLEWIMYHHAALGINRFYVYGAFLHD
jgi:hypothetical protein